MKPKRTFSPSKVKLLFEKEPLSIASAKQLKISVESVKNHNADFRSPNSFFRNLEELPPLNDKRSRNHNSSRLSFLPISSRRGNSYKFPSVNELPSLEIKGESNLSFDHPKTTTANAESKKREVRESVER